jgi:hypothetical protein
MSIILKVDNREKDLIQLLENRNDSFIKENLELGDIQFLEKTIY